MNIFVGNLPDDFQEDDLKKLFSDFGQVEFLFLVRDYYSKKSKGFGFIYMPNHLEAKTAIKELNLTQIKDKNIIVDELCSNSFEKNQNYDRKEGYNTLEKDIKIRL
ncbi:MAG: RNA-binding protein [Ignavibacterium sp.]|nr:RNA-binding protein [Ignavibacterium sp.]